MSPLAPLARLRALAADAGVRATATTRLIALAGAPVSIYLAATRLTPASQGYYFVAVNIIALAQLFEIGLGTIVVQFASHEWPKLRWGTRGGLEGEPAARDALSAVLVAAVRWYAVAGGVLFAIAGVGGLVAFSAGAPESVIGFVVLWCGFVAMTSVYLPLIPFIAVAEGCGDLVGVQRMRSWQAAALLIALWTGIVTRGSLVAAWMGASAQLVVAVGWLVLRHRDLLRAPATRRVVLHESARALPARFRTEQGRSAQLWVSLWLAPQLLTPIALKVSGGDSAGRLGVTLAIALAPLTLALAWLHGRYPSYGALVSEGRTVEFDAFARRATGEAVAVFAAAAVAVTGVVMLLPSIAPSVGARVLPLPYLLALFGGALASLLLQAMAGWLRAFRDEAIAGPIVGGATVTVLVAGVGAMAGGVPSMAIAFAAASLGIAVPVAVAHFVKVRRERMR